MPATAAPPLPPLSKPQPILHVAKALVPSPRQAQGQPQARGRGRAQPVVYASSKRLDGALSAGFVRLLNAGHVQDADPAAASGTDGRYDPKPGDFAVGVVVSGTEARLDVAVGADRLATLLAKELLPLDRDSAADPPARQALPRPGSIGVVAGPSVDEGGKEEARKQERGSRTLVAPGTVVFAEVLGRTLSGWPLLSARRLFRRLAWHRVSGLLHVSNISRGNVLSVNDTLKIDNELKVIVIKSNVPDKIALSIADLESAPGLFLSDREKVFSEAEEMAKRYREQLPVIPQNPILDDGLTI